MFTTLWQALVTSLSFSFSTFEAAGDGSTFPPLAFPRLGTTLPLLPPPLPPPPSPAIMLATSSLLSCSATSVIIRGNSHRLSTSREGVVPRVLIHRKLRVRPSIIVRDILLMKQSTWSSQQLAQQEPHFSKRRRSSGITSPFGQLNKRKEFRHQYIAIIRKPNVFDHDNDTNIDNSNIIIYHLSKYYITVE